MDLQPHLERFGLREFRPGQREVIEAVLAGRDCLCVMPTGGGKSLCYQLPSVAREGVTLVVSPLIALMKDQVDTLRGLGIRAGCVNSAMELDEQREQLGLLEAGELDLMYIAPERMRSSRFLEIVSRIHVQLLAVDEAHCISEWGHDFRPDYARLGAMRGRIGRPQTIALTATATDQVRQDIVAQLGFDDPQVFVTGFARPNLTFAVAHVSGQRDKQDRLLETIDAHPGAGLVYAATRKACEDLALILAAHRPRRRVGLYHAGLLKEDRRRMQDEFMDGTLDTIVATNAFGMGIDKRDLRFVVHYNMPGTLEAYYQEAGRAGRDGLPSHCLLLFSHSDRHVQEFFIENAHPPPQVVRAVYEYLRAQDEDPIEITLQQLKEQLELTVGSEGVGACEGILERCGAIKRLDSAHNKASVWLESDLPTLVDLLPREAKTQRKVLRAVEQLVGDQRYEQVLLPLQRLQAMSGLEREPLTRALRELSKLTAFDYVPPFRGRALHVVDRTRPYHELTIDFAEMERKKQLDYQKLERVVSYARTRGCRQLEFLRYFGERTQEACGRCDNCRSQGVQAAAPAAELDDPATLDLVRKALSGVARAQGRFGRQVVAQMLSGSRSAKMGKFRLDQLSTFGLLSTLTQQDISHLLDELQRVGLVSQVEIDRFRPVIVLAALGEEVMRGRSPLPGELHVPPTIARKLGLIVRRAPRPAPSPFVEPSPSVEPARRLDDPAPAFSPASSTPASAAATSAPRATAASVATPRGLAPGSDLPRSRTSSEDDSPPLDDSPAAEWHWTVRAVERGFSLLECAAIRRLSQETIARHLLQALDAGHELPSSTLWGEDADDDEDLPPAESIGELRRRLRSEG